MASTAVLVAAATVPVFATAWRVAHSKTRTVVRRCALATGGIAGLLLLAALFSLVQARSATNEGVSRVKAGLSAARNGDTNAAADALASATHSFASAQTAVGSWWTRPAELLPLAGQQIASVDRLTDAAERAAAAASKATTEADVNDLKMAGGHIDPAKVAATEQPLEDVLGALHEMSRAVDASRTGWLVRPLATRVDAVANELDAAESDAQLALDAVKVAPALLGENGPRHYFIAFGNPAESRDLGGFSGGYGELVIDNGTWTLVHTGKASELNEGGPHPLSDPNALPLRFRSFSLERFWQDVTSSPDFPTVSEAVRQLWPESGGGQLDGVLYVDPYAMAAVLKMVGSVTVPGISHPITADNIVPFLTRDQYTELDIQDDRHDLLSDTAKIVFDKLTSGDLPGPRTVADTLGPAAHEGRLLLHSFHPDEQQLFTELGIDGAIPRVDGDFLAVTMSNRGENKIDAYLTRQTAYDVRVNAATGEVHATVRVTLHNEAPASGLPKIVIGDNHLEHPDGTNTAVVSVMSPLSPEGATVDGQPVPLGPNTEYGVRTYSAALAIPAATTSVLEIQLHGVLPMTDGYRLTAVPRPNVGTEHLAVQVSTDGGPPIRSATGMAILEERAESDEDLTQNREYAVFFRRP